MLGRGQVLSGRLLVFKKIKQKSQEVGWSSLVMESASPQRSCSR